MIVDLEEFRRWLRLQGKSWQTCKGYLGVLRRWSAYLNGESPTSEAAGRFLDNEESSGKAVRSLYVYMSALRLYFRWRGSPINLDFPPSMAKRLREYCRKNYLGLKSGSTRISGKRARPELCELCKRNPRRLMYHHWDDEDYSKGLWLCWRCHIVAGAAEVGISTDGYLRLKQTLKADSAAELQYRISRLESVMGRHDELQ